MSSRELQRALGRVDRRHGRLLGPAVLAMDGRGHVLDLHHAVHVGRAELEHVLHAGERGDGVDIAVEALEHRAAALGPLVHQRQPVLVVVQRVEHDQARARVLGEVARRLREELVRERDPLVVDAVHLRDVGDVRHAVGARRGDDCGDRAFEARRDVTQGDVGGGCRVGIGHHDDTSIAAPAPGPGVWS